MKGRFFKRSFNASAIQHIYQRAKDRGVIFYSLEDRLVYYTVAAVQSRKHQIKVAASSIMYTHIHQSLMTESPAELKAYLHGTDTTFSRLYNFHYRRRGRLFEKPPGCAQKNDGKAIRTNIIYVFNNHVEKGLCSCATDERWSFLAYAVTDHPFSMPLDRMNASCTLRRALNKIDKRISKRQNIEYKDLDRVLKFLDSIEKEQLVDYIISKYAWIDFSLPMSLFGSRESLIMAADSTTGNEYDIREEYTPVSDKHYRRLIKYAERTNHLDDIFTLTDEEKKDIIVSYSRQSSAPSSILRKFYHCFD